MAISTEYHDISIYNYLSFITRNYAPLCCKNLLCYLCHWQNWHKPIWAWPLPRECQPPFNVFLNQARTIWCMPTAGRTSCGHTPGFLKLFLCVCMYVCMYICLSFRTHGSKPFTWSLKAACIQTIKAKQSLYYTRAQISSASKVCFFSNRKLGVATVHRLRS